MYFVWWKQIRVSLRHFLWTHRVEFAPSSGFVCAASQRKTTDPLNRFWDEPGLDPQWNSDWPSENSSSAMISAWKPPGLFSFRRNSTLGIRYLTSSFLHLILYPAFKIYFKKIMTFPLFFFFFSLALLLRNVVVLFWDRCMPPWIWGKT